MEMPKFVASTSIDLKILNMLNPLSMKKNNHLYVVKPDNVVLGPITRMGLWYRYPKANLQKLYLQIGAKLVLLATVIYVTKKMLMY